MSWFKRAHSCCLCHLPACCSSGMCCSGSACCLQTGCLPAAALVCGVQVEARRALSAQCISHVPQNWGCAGWRSGVAPGPELSAAGAGAASNGEILAHQSTAESRGSSWQAALASLALCRRVLPCMLPLLYPKSTAERRAVPLLGAFPPYRKPIALGQSRCLVRSGER